jgi:hypothetical protein
MGNTTTTTADLLELIDHWPSANADPSIRATCAAISFKIRTLAADGYIGDRYRTDYEVEGCDEFPIDMLRYTTSWPAREEDVYSISNGAVHQGDFRPNLKYTVRLSKTHVDPEPNLAEERWISKFRWQVTRIIETVQL